MEFIEIKPEIKYEPDVLIHVECPNVHDGIEIGQGNSPNSIKGQEENPGKVPSCDNLMEQQADGATTDDEEEPQESDDVFQDSGGVFKDHNYSLYKDMNKLDHLLMTYYFTVGPEENGRAVSGSNRDICSIMDLLSLIVAPTSTPDDCDCALDGIEQFTSLLRSKLSTPAENVINGNVYLKSIREASQFLNHEANKVANSLAEKANRRASAEEGENAAAQEQNSDDLLEKLKVDVTQKLVDLQLMSIAREELGIQTDDVEEEPPPPPPPPEMVDFNCQTEPEPAKTEEFSCQTDPEPISVALKPVKLFSSSDIETDSSAASGVKRQRKRKKKKELLKSFFDGDGSAEKITTRRPRVERMEQGSDDEIDRLINFNNLDRDYDENDQEVNRATKAAATEKEKKQKAVGETMEDILNGIDILNESGEDEQGAAATEEKHEEAKFLKQLNLEHKKLLLNSSSDEDDEDEDDFMTNSGNFDALLNHKTNVQNSSDESVIGDETVDLFLSDFKTIDEEKEKAKAERKKKKLEEKENDPPEAEGNVATKEAKPRRDSFEDEIAKLLREELEDDEEARNKRKNKAKKRPVVEEQPIDDTTPLDLSDTAGKRSRKESLEEAERDLSETLMQKRKLVLSSQTKESLDAMVLKVHQATKNPLLYHHTRPSAVGSPASVATSRDPDCISLSSSSSLEELVDLDRAGGSRDAAGSASAVLGAADGLATVAEDGTGDGGMKKPEPWKQRNPRKMMSEDKLDVNTKRANQDEQERIKLLSKKQDVVKKYLSEAGGRHEGEIVLDYDPKTKTVIKVHPEIVKHLKEHQVDGVKFMYDCVYGTVANQDKFKGSGCILAHCMGLGKTLQQITVMHTVVQYPELKTNRILVICPKSTVMNWVDEIVRWTSGVQDGVRLKVFFLPDQSDLEMRLKILQQWKSCGKSGYAEAGVMLVGHEAFRTLVLKKREIEAINDRIVECLLDPGPDLVICDEGHVIKNPKSAISKAMSKIKTVRRIILTGTPIQNNLKEYFCMVDFIKPMILGTLKEFCNLYANPIKSGQHKDSTKREINVMQKRSYVLHKKLEKFVQRKEAATLKAFLPEKFEYVIFVPLTPVQERLYKFFLSQNPGKEWNGKSLISDYTFLRKIWTHPKVLETAYLNAIAEQEKNKQREKEKRRQLLRENGMESEEDDPDDVLDKRSDSLSVTNDWWRSYLSETDLESLFPSHKLRIMFEILKQCRQNREKCLIFSAFVAVLNVVEYFMAKINANDSNAANYGLDSFEGPWVPGVDYYRLDGRTSKTTRHAMIKRFNDPQNTRVCCFLISAKAGGMGINLTGANRVIILDTSWNPSNDQQNIFRVFRMGQKRNCYVYRLLAMGTMEEKVYSRSVTKQALSYRVVDEQQIDRHYNMAELSELYVLSMPNFNDRPVPIRPSDRLLANLVHNFPNIIFKYHVHDSLLENKPEEDLSEEDKREAWSEYERQENRQAGMEFSALPGFDVFGNLTQSLAQLGGYPGMGQLAGPSGLSNNAMMSLYNQYQGMAADPYVQMYYAGLPPPPVGGVGPSSFNPLLAGGNRYFTSGSLFPPDGLPHPPPPPPPSSLSPIGVPVTSSGGGQVGGKKPQGRPRGSGSSARTGLNPFPSLTPQQLAAFDQSFMSYMTQGDGGVMGGGPGGGLPGSVSPSAANMGRLPGKGGNSSRRLNAPTPAVRIPSPPPFIPSLSQIQAAVSLSQQKKRPRILTKPVNLPPSTTIEKLPLSAAQGLSPLAKAPIIPPLAQSITVEKVMVPKPVQGGSAAAGGKVGGQTAAQKGGNPQPNSPMQRTQSPQTQKSSQPVASAVATPKIVQQMTQPPKAAQPMTQPPKAPQLLAQQLKSPSQLPPFPKAHLPKSNLAANIKSHLAQLTNYPGGGAAAAALAGKSNQPPPPPLRRSVSGQLMDKGKSLQPTAVIDLIDDVIDANPGLTVKPIKLKGTVGTSGTTTTTSTVTSAIAAGRGKEKPELVMVTGKGAAAAGGGLGATKPVPDNQKTNFGINYSKDSPVGKAPVTNFGTQAQRSPVVVSNVGASKEPQKMSTITMTKDQQMRLLSPSGKTVNIKPGAMVKGLTSTAVAQPLRSQPTPTKLVPVNSAVVVSKVTSQPSPVVAPTATAVRPMRPAVNIPSPVVTKQVSIPSQQRLSLNAAPTAVVRPVVSTPIRYGSTTTQQSPKTQPASAAGASSSGQSRNSLPNLTPLRPASSQNRTLTTARTVETAAEANRRAIEAQKREVVVKKMETEGRKLTAEAIQRAKEKVTPVQLAPIPVTSGSSQGAGGARAIETVRQSPVIVTAGTSAIKTRVLGEAQQAYQKAALQKSAATQIMLKMNQGGDSTVKLNPNGPRLVVRKATSSSQPVATGNSQSPAKTITHVAGLPKPSSTQPSSSGVKTPLKRPATVPITSLGPIPKKPNVVKVGATPATASGTSLAGRSPQQTAAMATGTKTVVPGTVPSSLTVIQKNLQRRQNGNLP